MSYKRKKIIKYIAAFLALLLWMDPVSALAAEASEELILLEEEGSVPFVTASNEAGIDTEAIYNSIDVEALRASIDIDELMALIDEDELLAQIDEEELRAELARREAEKESQRQNLEIESGTIDLTPNTEKDLPPDVTRIVFPVIENNNLFDFIMDPLGLVYMTNAAKYGGGKVQEGATLLFKNNDGDYLFSDTSDYLSFRNKGNVPVKVTIRATITGLGDLKMSEDKTFGRTQEPAIYLALTDSHGNERPLLTDEETVIETVLDASDGDRTVYKWNSETGSYEATETMNVSDPGAYFFALTGCCNPDAEWQSINCVPTVKVSWSAHSLTGEELEAAKAEEAQEKEEEEQQESGASDEEFEELLEEENSEEESSEGENSEDENSREENEAVPERRLTLEEAKLEELRREKLEELKQQKLQELIEEKLKELIQEEFERLYQEALSKKSHSEAEPKEPAETKEPETSKEVEQDEAQNEAPRDAQTDPGETPSEKSPEASTEETSGASSEASEP